MATNLVLDCDTGTDDAVAVMLAALHPDLELLGVTTVWGNHDVRRTTDNTLRVLHHVGRDDVPVHAGLDRPFRPRSEPLPSGRSDLEPTLPLPEAPAAPASGDAVGWLVDTVRRHDDVALVTTGPLTNLASALERAPGLVDGVARLVVLGGTRRRPGVTPHAERNVWCDPHAAAAVLAAGWRDLLLVTMDATFAAPLTSDDAARLRATGTPAGTAAAAFVEDRIRWYRRDETMAARAAAPLHDPLAVACLLDPSLLDVHHAGVAVELADPERYAATYLDLHASRPTLRVALDADGRRYVELLAEVLALDSAGPRPR